MSDILHKKVRKKRPKPFILNTSVKDLRKEIGMELPGADEVYKVISLYGGVASLTFIKLVADFEPIEELTASTLRIGEKQFMYLQKMSNENRVKKARFFTSTMMKNVDAHSHGGKYNYAGAFADCCRKNGWKHFVINNHSKVILMKTAGNYYVLETSSNLNENPKIEQYSFENSKEVYDFYYGFFDALEDMAVRYG